MQTDFEENLELQDFSQFAKQPSIHNHTEFKKALMRKTLQICQHTLYQMFQYWKSSELQSLRAQDQMKELIE